MDENKPLIFMFEKKKSPYLKSLSESDMIYKRHIKRRISNATEAKI